MGLIHVPIESSLHTRIRARVASMRARGLKVTWESLLATWGEAWLAVPSPAPVPPAPKHDGHRPGCGKGGRGCVAGCPHYDPRVDE